MSQLPLTRSDIRAALLAARTAGIVNSGAFYGLRPPSFKAGRLYLPHWLHTDVQIHTTSTANRLFRTYFHVWETTTFLGGWFRNAGASDTGKKVRIGIWTDAGVLVKDFGETVLGGAAATNLVANSVMLTPGWYQIGLVSDTTPDFACMAPLSNGTQSVGVPIGLSGCFGNFAAAAVGGPPGTAQFVGEYAAFTYGALPDPITTATASVGGWNNSFPAVGLYL